MLKPIDELSDKEKLGLRKSCGKGMAYDTAILVYRLEDNRLYTLQDMAGTMYDPGSALHRQMVNRLKSFLWYRKVKPEGGGVNAWYGRTVKELLEPRYQYMAERSIALLATLHQVAREKQLQQKKPASAVIVKQPIQNTPSLVEHKEKAAGRKPVSLLPLPSRNRPLRWLVAAMGCLIVLSGLVGTAALFLKPRAYRILREEGLNQALRYVYSSTPRDQKELYQQAWMDYRNADYQVSELKATQLLTNLVTSEKMRGDSWYLKAQICLATSRYEDAIDALDHADRTYQVTGPVSNQYRCALGMAKAYLGLGELEEVERYLEVAYDHYLSSAGLVPHLGWYYSVRVRLALRQGLYDEALDLTRTMAEIYEDHDEKDGLAGAWIDLGFLYMVNGNLQRGFHYTVRAQSLIMDMGDRRKHVYNLKNYILYQTCLGQEPDVHIISEIEHWSRLYRDDELRYYLWFARNYCRGGTNEPGASTIQTTQH